MIRARGIEKRYGRRRVLAGIDLDVAAGDKATPHKQT